MADFLQFLILVFKHVASWLGAISLAVGIWNKALHKEWFFKNKTYIRLAIFLMFIGCFQVWKSEHQNLILSQNNLASEIKKHTGLRGTIDELARYKVPTMQGILVVIELSVKNLGEQTIVENYYLTVKSDRLNLFSKNLLLDPPIDIPAAGGAAHMIFTEKDALYNKTASPIASNDQRRGWLIYQFPSATWEQLADTNNQFIISYDDTAGQRYYVTNDNLLLSGNGLGVFPGAYPPVQN
jgi:hypothetical protein